MEFKLWCSCCGEETPHDIIEKIDVNIAECIICNNQSFEYIIPKTRNNIIEIQGVH